MADAADGSTLWARCRRAASRAWGFFRIRASRDTVLLIFACGSGLSALIYLQLSWIGAARDSRLTVLNHAFTAAMEELADGVRQDAAQMLMQFRAATLLDAMDPAGASVDLREFWAEDAAWAPALKRALLFDLPEEGGATSGLRVLDTETGTLRPAEWPRGLLGLEAKLLTFWSRYGERANPLWFATWMVYPDYSVVVRPLMLPPRRPEGLPGVRGHLILQVDFEYLVEKIVMNRLRRDLEGLGVQTPYEVALVWSREVARVFRPISTASASALAGGGRQSTRQYELGPRQAMAEVSWLEDADWRQALLLLDGYVSPTAVAKGATQRVRLGPIGGIRRPADDPAELVQSALGGSAAQFAVRPRVYVSSERQHRLELASHRLSGAVDEALAQQYWWNAFTSLGVLALLGIAIALVATGARRASRLAEMRMAFVANVSHELRTPVASMQVIGQNIADGLVGSDRRLLRYGELVRDQAKRLGQMIEDTLLLSRIESGEKPLDLQSVAAGPVIREAVAHVRPLIERTGFDLECVIPEGLQNVQADENALRQSLSNLLTNAVKHAPQGRWLKVEAVGDAGEHPGQVEIRVHDRGPGIDPAEARRVFEPYYRSGSAIRGAVPGSGMGLSLASNLVRMMGGRLALHSDLGRGSVFTIRLPVARRERPGNA